MLNTAILNHLPKDSVLRRIVQKVRHRPEDDEFSGFTRLLEEILIRGRTSLRIRRVLRFVRLGQMFNVEDEIPWEDLSATQQRQVEVALRDFYAQGAVSAESAIAPSLRGAFDITNSQGIAWAKKQSAELITQITKQSRKNIRKVIARAMEGGLTSATAAREIREILLRDINSSIGLNERQALSVRNFEARLLAEGVSAENAARRAERFSRQVLNRRAKMIARTEIINAQNEGKLQRWKEFLQQGLISNNMVKQWVVVEDGRLDPDICAPMRGQIRELDEFFTTGTGARIQRPTAHPMCRCSMDLIERPEEPEPEIIFQS